MVLQSSIASSQKLGVYNAKDKLIYKISAGKSLDFRIDFDKLYPDKQDSVLEVRMYSTVDSIAGNMLFLTENQVVLNYSKNAYSLVETDFEFTELMIQMEDIKAVTFSNTMDRVGSAFFILGIAALIVSPLMGLSSSGYSTDRVFLVAGMGLGTMAIGGGISLAFKQKPVQIKDFDGPPYFKKYQRGTLSIIK